MTIITLHLKSLKPLTCDFTEPVCNFNTLLYPIMTRVKFRVCHFTLSNDAFAISFQFGYLALFTKVFPLEQISRKVKGAAGMNKKVECEEVLFLFEA